MHFVRVSIFKSTLIFYHSFFECVVDKQRHLPSPPPHTPNKAPIKLKSRGEKVDGQGSPVNAPYPHPVATTFSIHEKREAADARRDIIMCVPNIFCLLLYNGIALYNYSVYCFLCTVYCNRKLTLKKRMGIWLYSVYCVYFLLRPISCVLFTANCNTVFRICAR